MAGTGQMPPRPQQPGATGTPPPGPMLGQGGGQPMTAQGFSSLIPNLIFQGLDNGKQLGGGMQQPGQLQGRGPMMPSGMGQGQFGQNPVAMALMRRR